MPKLSTLLLLLGFFALAAPVNADLAGRSLVLETGTQSLENTPIYIEHDGPAQESQVVVVNSVTGEELPTTQREGHVVFIVKSAPAHATIEYEVRTAKGKGAQNVSISGDGALEVKIDGELFTAYHFADSQKKPFLWPVNSEGGQTITRDWPMGEKTTTADHPHHTSLYTAYGDINGADCWGEGESSGYQVTREVTHGSGGAYGWIRAENVWEDKEHKPVVSETREYRFYNTPAQHRIFDITITFTADFGDAKFGDTKEGGLVGVRMHDDLRERGGSGKITTGAGAVGALAAWGKPAPWCDYSGTFEGLGTRGLAIFDHPSNLRHPTTWHVRDYGLMGANCFGYSYFTKGKENGDYLLPSGESLTFHYRVLVHSGAVVEAGVAESYSHFATPPSIRWK